MKKIFIDCGAHTGNNIRNFKRLFPDHAEYELHCFEPNPRLRARFERIDASIIFHENAVWDKNTELDFYLGKPLASSLIKSKKTGDLDFEHPVKVAAIDLSKWIGDNFSIEDTIILNMDIEGAEYTVLEGLENSGKLDWIDELFVEFHETKIEISKDRHDQLVARLIKHFGDRISIWNGHRHSRFIELNEDLSPLLSHPLGDSVGAIEKKSYRSAYKEFTSPLFSSYRRFLLDKFLKASSPVMRGNVIDLGGKKNNKRGRFLPPKDNVASWVFVNLDQSTEPDLLEDVCNTSLDSNSADCVICTEVLEHISTPQLCVDEALRLVKPEGTVIATIPFMHPVHADPHDYQRFTADGLRRLFVDFNEVEILSMGGFYGTLGALLEQRIKKRGRPNLRHKLSSSLIKRLSRIAYWQDSRLKRKGVAHFFPEFTTGYFVIARKQSNQYLL